MTFDEWWASIDGHTGRYDGNLAERLASKRAWNAATAAERERIDAVIRDYIAADFCSYEHDGPGGLITRIREGGGA